jgi:hypothetical protein
MTAYAGDTACLRCGTTGDAHHVILSTPEVERVGRALADHLRPLCTTKGRMLGLLFADGDWVVTLSSVAAVSQDFVEAVMDFAPGLSPIAHDWSTVPKRSLGGHDLSAWLQPPTASSPLKAFVKVVEPQATGTGAQGSRRSLPLAGGPGCLCAAPKLFSYLTQDAGAAHLPPAQLTMIELWCGASQGSWVHGAFAVSCGNCSRILPTLACRAPR